MTDHLLKEATWSLARYLNLASGKPTYIVTPDFDWDKHPDGSDRSVPFFAIKFIQGIEQYPFADGTNTIDPRYTFVITCAHNSYSYAQGLFGECSQLIKNATGIASGVRFYDENYPGIPLRNSEDVTAPDRIVGVFNVDYEGSIDFNDPTEQSRWQNLKFAGHLPITLSPIYKDFTKDLL